MIKRSLEPWQEERGPETRPKRRPAGHVVDAGEYTVFVCHDSRGLGGDAGHVEGLSEAETGKCLRSSVTL